MDGVYERVRMSRLTTVGGTFTAHVIAARLEAEGITVKLRGAVDSPYQFTVGDMSRVDVFVPEHELDDATLVLLVDEVDAVLDLPPQKERPSDFRWGDRALWVVVVAVLLLWVFPLVEAFSG
ncbi:MAG: hypothetical protein ACRD0C_03370 [Acidimicrobiia bacterium]